MKKIISVFLCALIFAALSLPVFAADGEDIRTDVELVYAKYRPESDDYSVIVAWGYGFKSPEGEINWYYVFAPDIIPADMFASDGSQAADELLSAVKEGKPIPARTAVELVSESEDGIFVLDSYPPQLVGYSEVKFLGEPQKAYSLTDEAIRKEIDGINSLRSFDNWYPYPDGSYSEADLKAEMDAFNEEFSGSTQGDYPAMIFYNGVLYKLADSALELPQDVDFASLGTLSYVEGEPTVSGTQNYSLDPVDFAEAVYNGVDCLVALCDGDFRFFLPYGVTVPEFEEQSYQSVPNPGALNPEYKNPETGAEGGALAVTALAAAVCTIMLRKRGAEKRRNDPKEKI